MAGKVGSVMITLSASDSDMADDSMARPAATGAVGRILLCSNIRDKPRTLVPVVNRTARDGHQWRMEQ